MTLTEPKDICEGCGNPADSPLIEIALGNGIFCSGECIEAELEEHIGPGAQRDCDRWAEEWRAMPEGEKRAYTLKVNLDGLGDSVLLEVRHPDVHDISNHQTRDGARGHINLFRGVLDPEKWLMYERIDGEIRVVEEG